MQRHRPKCSRESSPSVCTWTTPRLATVASRCSRVLIGSVDPRPDPGALQHNPIRRVSRRKGWHHYDVAPACARVLTSVGVGPAQTCYTSSTLRLWTWAMLLNSTSPNKGMKQTSVEHIGRSQLIPGVRQSFRLRTNGHGHRPHTASHGDRPTETGYGDRLRKSAYGDRPTEIGYGDRLRKDGYGRTATNAGNGCCYGERRRTRAPRYRGHDGTQLRVDGLRTRKRNRDIGLKGRRRQFDP